MDPLLSLIDSLWFGEHLPWTAQALLRLMAAAALGGFIGLERELRGRQAGFRTYMLVSLGSALVMVVSVSFAHEPWDGYAGFESLQVDPGRIAYGVMTGVGFLGAGTIIQRKGAVRGLTTAAGIWCAAAVGLAAGFGQYVVAAFATGLVIVALWVLDLAERVIPQRNGRAITLRGRYRPGIAQDVAARLRREGFRISEQNFHRDEKDFSEVEITMRVSMRGEQAITMLESIFLDDPDLQMISTREAGD